MKALTTLELTLPAHWAPALINGDSTGLTGFDVVQMAECIDGWRQAEGIARSPLDVSADAFLTRGHDAAAFGVLPATCLVYTFALVPGAAAE